MGRGFAKKEKIWGTTDAEMKPLHIVRVTSIRAYLPFKANGCFIFREMHNALMLMQKKRDLVSSLIKIFFILCSLQLVLLESKSALDVLTKSTFVGYDNPIFLDVTRFHQDIMGVGIQLPENCSSLSMGGCCISLVIRPLTQSIQLLRLTEIVGGNELRASITLK